MNQLVDLVDGESLLLQIEDSPVLPLEVRKRLQVVLKMSRGVQLLAPVRFQTLSWAEVAAFQDPLEVVRRIESSLGLTPARQPNYLISPRALAFIVLALFLATRVNDPKPWHVRGLFARSFGIDEWAPADVSRFPVLEDMLLEPFENEALGGPPMVIPPGWLLYHGAEPVAAVDELGGLHSHGVRFDLHEIYVNTGCDMHATAAIASTNIKS